MKSSHSELALSILLAGCLLFSIPVASAPPVPAPVQAKLAAELREAGLSAIQAADLKLDFIAQNNSYETIAGAYRFSISADGSVALHTPLLAEEQNQPMDEARMASLRKDLIAGISEADMIIFAPKDKPAVHTVTIFTDVTCPYSKALHQDLDILLDEGIRVRYLAFPRYGLQSLGAKKMMATWCNADRAAALNEAMQDRRIKLAPCANPVEAQFLLGESIAIEGTPAIVFEDGSILTGYGGALDVLQHLEQPAPAKLE